MVKLLTGMSVFYLLMADKKNWMAIKRFADMTAGSDEARIAEYMAQQGYLPANDTDCPDNAGYPRFCPNAPLRRASAAVMMSRALALIN